MTRNTSEIVEMMPLHCVPYVPLYIYTDLLCLAIFLDIVGISARLKIENIPPKENSELNHGAVSYPLCRQTHTIRR